MEILDWRDERIPELAVAAMGHFLAVGEAAAAYREAIERNSDERAELAALVAARLCRWQRHQAVSFCAADGRKLTDISVLEGLALIPSDAPRDAGLMAGVPIEPLVARVREVSAMHIATRLLAELLAGDVTMGWEAFRYAVAQAMVAAREARP